MKLSFLQRMELTETGFTQQWVGPEKLPDDEITFGEWVWITKQRGKIVKCHR
jgi:hypothetical protein